MNEIGVILNVKLAVVGAAIVMVWPEVPQGRSAVMKKYPVLPEAML